MALAALGRPSGAPTLLLRLHAVPGAPLFAFRASARHLHVATDEGYWVLGGSPHLVARGSPLCCAATFFKNARVCVGVVVREEGL